MHKSLLSAVAVIALLMGSVGPTWAEGKKTGFASDSGQGNLDNDNAKNEPNKGTVTVSGPKGQVDKGNTDCNNCTSSGPGNK